MFSLFKNKLLSVKEEVTSSIRSVIAAPEGEGKVDINSSVSATSLSNLPGTLLPDHDTSAGLPVNPAEAPFELLHRYETEWSNMRARTEHNAKNADRLSKHVNSTQTSVHQLSAKIRTLREETTSLPLMSSAINQINTSIVDLHSLCWSIENDLDKLEGICKEQEFQNSLAAEVKNLKKFEEVSQAEVKRVKVLLAAEHAKNLKRFEAHQAAELRKKQQAYQQAFEEDVERYKAEQKIMKANAQLASIIITPEDAEQQRLEQFLQSPEEASNTQPIVRPNDIAEDHPNRVTLEENKTNETPESSKQDPHISPYALNGDAHEREARQRTSTDVSQCSLVSSGESTKSMEWDIEGDQVMMTADEEPSVQSAFGEQ